MALSTHPARRASRAGIAGLVLALAGAVGLVALSGPSVAAFDPGPGIQVPGFDRVDAVGCPNDSTCIAVGNTATGEKAVPLRLLGDGSVDPGSAVAVPAIPYGFACNSHGCVAVEGAATGMLNIRAYLVDGSGSLQLGPLYSSPQAGGVFGVDCTEAGCWAVGTSAPTAGYVRPFNFAADGVVTSGPAESTEGVAATDIACVSTTKCLIAGLNAPGTISVGVLTATGSDFGVVSHTLPGAAGSQTTVDCPYTDACLVGGSVTASPVFIGGSDFSVGAPIAVPSGTDLADVVCARFVCQLVGAGGNATTAVVMDTATTGYVVSTRALAGTPRDPHSTDANGCTPGSGRCFAGTEEGTVIPLPVTPVAEPAVEVPGIDRVLGFDCLTDTRCVAFGEGAAVPHAAVPVGIGPGGAASFGTPVRVSLTGETSSTQVPLAFTCSSSACVVTSVDSSIGNPQVTPITVAADGALDALPGTQFPGTGLVPYGASCADDGACMAVGLAGGAHYAAFGVSASGALVLGTATPIDGMNFAWDVDCPGTARNVCVVVGSTDGRGMLSVGTGLKELQFPPAVEIPGTSTPRSVDCGTVLTCAVSNNGAARMTPITLQGPTPVFGTGVALPGVTFSSDLACTGDLCHVVRTDDDADSPVLVTSNVARRLPDAPLDAPVYDTETSDPTACTPTTGFCYAGTIDGRLIALQATYGAAPTNHAPTVSTPIPNRTATEDSAFSYQVPSGAFTDADGDTLSYAASRGDGTALPSWLTFTPGTRTFSGTPLQANVGSVAIKVTATDPGGLSASDDFTLTVNAVNDSPTLVNPLLDKSVAEDSAFSYVVPANTFSDPDNATLTYSATKGDGTALPSWLTFTPASRTFSGTPLEADVGSFTVKVSATDPGGLSASDLFTLTVTGVNDPPVLATPIPNQGATEDTAFSYTFPANTFSDPEHSTLTYTATRGDGTALPSWLTFSRGTRTFTGTPLQADAGTLTIKVTAKDSGNLAATDSFDLVVTAVNDAPTVANAIADVTTKEDSFFSFTVPANTFADAENDSLTYSTSSRPSWLSFDAATRTFSGTPRQGDVGAVDITVTAKDPSNASASDTFRLTVANVNDAPSASLGLSPALVRTDDTVVATATKVDQDGDPVTLTFLWTVTRGSESCVVREVSTSSGLTDSLDLGTTYSSPQGCTLTTVSPSKGDTVTVTVTPSDGTVSGTPVGDNRVVANSAPVLTLTGTTLQLVTYGSAISPVTASATDADGDAITFSSAGLPAGVTLTGSGNSRTISGVTTATGSYAAQVTASDGSSSDVEGLTVIVGKKTLTVTALGATRTWGTANPTFGATYAGFVNGDTTAVLTGSPSLTTTATPMDHPGGYPITAAQGTLAATNYDFAFTNGTLTVTKAPIVVTVTDPSLKKWKQTKVFTQTAKVTHATTGAGIAGVSVTFTIPAVLSTMTCTAVTNAQGVASCNATANGLAVVVNKAKVTATAATTTDTLAGTGTGKVVN